MKFAIQVTGLFIALPLEILIIAALVRYAYRRFPILLVYAIFEFLTTVLEIPPALDAALGIRRTSNTLQGLYWPIDILIQILLNLVVISLVFLATERLAFRRSLRLALIVVTILVAVGSFAAFYDPALHPAKWITPWDRNMNFIAAVLDLALWALLIAQRDRDTQLLLLSGGLGIQLAGDAIANSIQQLGIQTNLKAVFFTGSILRMIAFLMFQYIWWQALRQSTTERRAHARAHS